MSYHGDIRLGDTIDVKFTSRAFASGAPTTLAGTPSVAAYPANSTTEITAGITLSVDFDSRTGLNNVRVVATSGNGYATATNYELVITAGTVGGTSVVGEVVGSFSIENRSALMPTTVARTLVVDASGLADANMVKAGPTGSGTAQTARDLGASVLLSTGTGTGQLDFTSGVVKANLAQILGTALTETAGQLAAAFKKFFNIGTPAATMDHLVLVDTVTTATTATNLTNAPTAGDFTATMKTSIGTAVAASAVASVTAGVTLAAGAITNASLAADSGLKAIRIGTAQAGAATSITLDSGASATDSIYNNDIVLITGGTGAGQARFISAYVGSTKVATVAAWQTNPDNTSTFAILPFDAVAGATVPTVAQIATGVWQDTTAGDFTTALSVGKSLMNGVSLGTGLKIAECVLTDTLTTYTGNTPQTGDAYARLGAPAGASVSADIAAVAAAIAALNNLSAAQVKTQAVAALSTDTYAEPGQGTPTATIDLATKISYLFKFAINKMDQTASLFEGYNNAGTVVDQKAAVTDDGTTFTRAKLSTGP